MYTKQQEVNLILAHAVYKQPLCKTALCWEERLWYCWDKIEESRCWHESFSWRERGAVKPVMTGTGQLGLSQPNLLQWSGGWQGDAEAESVPTFAGIT